MRLFGPQTEMSPFDAPAGAAGNGTSSATSPGGALTDTWIGGLLIASVEMTTRLDFFMLARPELGAGRDPRVAVQAALDGPVRPAAAVV